MVRANERDTNALVAGAEMRGDILRHVTTPDAARILGISEAGVRMLVMRGELEPLERSTRPLIFREGEVVELEYRMRTKGRREEVQRLAREWALASG